jgi:hypothetical protein
VGHTSQCPSFCRFYDQAAKQTRPGLASNALHRISTHVYRPCLQPPTACSSSHLYTTSPTALAPPALTSRPPSPPAQPFKPLLKFVLIKTVIFLTFWQGLVISMIASWVPSVQDTSDQKALQNFMICVEMLCAACMLLIAFPHTEYHIGGAAQGMRFGAMFHALSLRDVIADVVHQFAPTYHEYVLYSDGGPAENVKRWGPHATGRAAVCR